MNTRLPSSIALGVTLFVASLLLAAPRTAAAQQGPATQQGPAAASAPAGWEAVLERAVPAVVAIRVTATRDFDTERAGSSVGTGFVVDAERGIILTNRHMVHEGPVLAEAVFENHEEVALQPIYRDPVHDFGFYRFDPDDVQFMALSELELAPEDARVGMEIRVVGNDAGEKLSILDGTLARLDRSAPNYGSSTYNDFNTFYYQAASNTSGGSSGSPVLSKQGTVVALNAGGSRRAASAFYLPLHRVVRALDLIRQGEPVTRGSLQTVFRYEPYDEVRRLGVREATEAAYREAFPDAIGMLVVRETVAGGPAHDLLRPGDVLVSLEGERLVDFAQLEAVLDEAVGGTVSVTIERGGEPKTLQIEVHDLHTSLPAEYLEVGRAILTPVSYQQARNHSVPAAGVYVTTPGYMLGNAGVPARAVLDAVDGEPVPDLDALQVALEAIPDGQRFRLRFHRIQDVRDERETVVTMDRTWYPMRRCRRDDATGRWPCADAAAPPAPVPPEAQTADYPPVKGKVANKVARGLVMVETDLPYPTAGMKDFTFQGTGLVVDAQRGLVLVDRDTVPVALADLTLTFAGQVRVPGQLVFLHPVHNVAVVSYDPALLGDTPVQSLDFDPRPLEPGDKVWQVGLNSSFQVTESATRVTALRPLSLGMSGTPRFRDRNVEGLWVGDSLPTVGGVLADRRGRVRAGWFSFVDQREDERRFYGLPVATFQSVLDDLVAGVEPTVYDLGVEVWPMSLADARDRGLSDARADELLDHDPEGTALIVVRVTGGSPAAETLRRGDLLLAIDGQPVSRPRDLLGTERLKRATLTVLRDGEEREVEVEAQKLPGRGVTRIATFAGALVHEPHHEVAAQKGADLPGVYIAWMWYGSPSQKYGLRPTRRIVEINGTPTPTFDAFVETVSGLEDGQAVRVLYEALDGQVGITTLKMDLAYWPTETLTWDEEAGWERRAVD